LLDTGLRQVLSFGTMRPRWIVQTNLGSAADVEQLRQACAAQGLPFVGVAAIPFSDELPAVEGEGPAVLYGSTRFVQRMAAGGRFWPGTFFDEATFQFAAWQRAWGAHLLNAAAEHTTLGALAERALPPDALLFVRPERDLKEFAGEVLRFGELAAWVERLTATDLTLDRSCPVVVAEPVGIAEEWRLVLVAGRVVAGSRYRVHHRLAVAPAVPDEVVRFAEARAAEWAPAPAFVLDVGRSGPGLYVIECNCFNSAGFYACDVGALVGAISAWVDRAEPPRGKLAP
jgi:hypothetical protein